MKSFRVRLLLGSLVWTVAILSSSHMLFQIVFFSRFPLRHRIILIVSLLAMGVGAVLVSSTLIPFRRLRSQLLELREGRRQALEGVYPTEIQPLVDDLNDLLEQREGAVQRAQAKAGDLAHGLKTPLAILGQEAERGRAEGNEEFALVLLQQIGRMRRQIDYHLAQSLAGSSLGPGLRSSVKETSEALIRTLKRLHHDRDLVFDLGLGNEDCVRVRQEDLEEILGNVLDNACKWSRRRVSMLSELSGSQTQIVIEDDGPGISQTIRETVLERGVRADEATPGSGLGLAIVRELVATYGGTIHLGDASVGGLAVTIRLPTAG